MKQVMEMKERKQLEERQAKEEAANSPKIAAAATVHEEAEDKAG